jgi:hypothetical protein
MVDGCYAASFWQKLTSAGPASNQNTKANKAIEFRVGVPFFDHTNLVLHNLVEYFYFK